jgi:hypothetical protein
MTTKEERVGTQKAGRRRARPVYTLEELLAECDFTKRYSAEELAFLHSQPIGRELL